MTTRNNFTKAESGPSIEVTCFYDADRSRMDFNENIVIVQHETYYKKSIGYYVDNGNVAGPDSITFTIKGKRADLVKYWTDNCRYYDVKEVKKMKMPELAQEILNSLDQITLANFEAESDSLNKYNLDIVPSKAVEYVDIHGYSQGDYARVYYAPDDFEQAWGNKPRADNIKEMVTHYYYDAPVYACATIDGTEYHYHDMPEYDEYSYDRDLFAAYVAKESGVPIEAIKSLLPESPSY